MDFRPPKAADTRSSSVGAHLQLPFDCAWAPLKITIAVDPWALGLPGRTQEILSCLQIYCLLLWHPRHFRRRQSYDEITAPEGLRQHSLTESPTLTRDSQKAHMHCCLSLTVPASTEIDHFLAFVGSPPIRGPAIALETAYMRSHQHGLTESPIQKGRTRQHSFTESPLLFRHPPR